MKEEISLHGLTIHSVPIHKLKTAEYNPRKHTPKQFEELSESISRYGLIDPLIANWSGKRKNVLIWGHFRLAVAEKLGFERVPVVYVNIPELEREKELNLRLNRNSGEWDFELLKDFDLDLLLDVGFEELELSKAWDPIFGVEDDGFNEHRKVLESEGPTARTWDIYALGDHRLLCGDTTNPENVLALAKSADAAGRITVLAYDPPYNIGLDYGKGLSGASDYGEVRSDDRKSEEEYRTFLLRTFENTLAVAWADLHAFCYCDPNYIGLVQDVFREIGLSPKRVCLWIKDRINATPKVAFNRGYEPCVYATKGDPYISSEFRDLNEIFDREVGTGNRTIDDVADLFDIWLAKRLAANEYEHPTAKPPTLHEKYLKRCTKAGDFVLDCFAGSGSTLVACEALGRRALLMEREPVFVEAILHRYETLTGKAPVKLDPIS